MCANQAAATRARESTCAQGLIRIVGVIDSMGLKNKDANKKTIVRYILKRIAVGNNEA